MKLFTMGPVEAFDAVRVAAAAPLLYFRTEAFSQLLRGLERDHLALIGAPAGSRAAFLTASGTGAMEAALAGCFRPGERLLVVVAGTFGQRMMEICARFDLAAEALVLPEDRSLRAEDLPADRPGHYAGLVLTVHETSTGVLHDAALAGEWARRNGALFVADAISAFLADPFDMSALRVDLAISSSHKALALAPGLSFLTASPAALARIAATPQRSFYFDLHRAFEDGLRGQTPWTPAVGILQQMRARLDSLDLDAELRRTAELAADFRARLRGLPLTIAARDLSNALTPLRVEEGDAADLVARVAERHAIMLQPCGGARARSHIRVGHIGNLTLRDNDALLRALADVCAARRAA